MTRANKLKKANKSAGGNGLDGCCGTANVSRSKALDHKQSATESLGRLTVKRKTGREPFHRNGRELDFDLVSFWQWSTSDLVSNATRGRLAEYLIARALGIAKTGIREEWAAFDLQMPSGVKIEVKSAAYVQSWHQATLSPIMFLVPKTRGWDASTNKLSGEARRQADIYVFALLAHTDKHTIDPLNVNQWQFYVLPTAILDARKRSQHSITLKSLEQLCGRALHYTELRAAVGQLTELHSPVAK